MRTPICLLLLTLGAFAQVERDPSQLSEEEKRAIAEKVMALRGPGPEHEVLAARVGEFDTRILYWMQPGGEPMVFEGHASARLILGGRFLLTEGQSGDGPYQVGKLSLLGFDRRAGKYTFSGYDTMGTYAVHAEGSYDAEARTLTFSGTDYDPIMQVTQEFDFVFHFEDADHSRMEVWFKDTSHGNETPFKMVEVQSTRKQ